MKSGLCPEDCHYCSQRRDSTADILKYPMVGAEESVEAATRAVHAGAKRLCMVASGRGPAAHELDQVATNIRAVKEAYPDLEICACLGLLQDGQAETLKDAGVYAYNHNLNTSEKHYDQVCGTHTYADRQQTVGRAAKARAVALLRGSLWDGRDREGHRRPGLRPTPAPTRLRAHQLPDPHRRHAPLAGRFELTPQCCLRILALYRFYFPDVEVRIAGGREVHLRSLQPLGLMIANSIFAGDYLTTEGQPAGADLQVIADLGFEVEGATDATLPRDRAEVSLRRRGAGIEVPANS